MVQGPDLVPGAMLSGPQGSLQVSKCVIESTVAVLIAVASGTATIHTPATYSFAKFPDLCGVLLV